MSKKAILFILVIVYSVGVQAQNMSAFIDNNGAFKVFDNGQIVYEENVTPLSFKVGGNCVAFIDNETIFKIYYKGEIIKPYGDYLIDNYTVTHNLVLFSIKKKLLVFDNGKTNVLVNNDGHIIAFGDNGVYTCEVSDSLVVFQDINTKILQVYCNGVIDTLATPPPAPNSLTYNLKLNWQGYKYNYLLGKNTVAFMSDSTFKVFYQNKLYTLLNFPPSALNYPYPIKTYHGFKCGNNIVGFINPFTKKLCAFYKGENYIMPTNYLCGFEVGDDMLTYTDSLGVHVFYAGKIYDIPGLNASFIKQPPLGYYASLKTNTDYTYKPSYATNSFSIKDGVMLFYVMGRYKVFNKGYIYEIGDIDGGQVKIDGNTISWIDHQNTLNTLYKGAPFILSTLIKPSNYTVTGNTVWFKTSTNEDKVFFAGKIY